MSDESNLVSALRRRDPEAFNQVFKQYSDQIFRLAFGILKSEDEAEGIVQDTFLTLFRKLNQFEARSRLSTWLYRVAYNLSTDRLRKMRPTEPLADEPHLMEADGFMPVVIVDWNFAPETILSQRETHRVLGEAIDALPQKLHTTFVLRELEKFSTVETATILGIKPGTVKVQLHRARLLLREHLSSYFQERLPVTREAK